MSGEKDVRVEAIDLQRMHEEAMLQAERARERERMGAARAAAERNLADARSRLNAMESARAEVASRHAALESSLQELSADRARMERRIDQMRKETTATRDRAHDLGSGIADDQKRLQDALALLARKERELLDEQHNLQSRIAHYDGHELLEARAATEKAEAEQSRLGADLARLEAEIAGYQSSPALGFVLQQMVSSFSEFAFHVDRAHVSEAEIEVVMTRNGEETVRIATAMIDEKLKEAKLDPRLRLLIERTEPNVEACITDTMKIMQRLREKGVAVSLEVRERPIGRTAEPERTAEDRSRTK